MRYEVPQFSEVQTKVIGPFTLKQFMYLAIGGGLFYLFFKTLSGFLSYLIGLPALVLGIVFAFVKVNGLTMEQLTLRFFKFAFRPKMYTWRKETPQEKKVEYETDEEE